MLILMLLGVVVPPPPHVIYRSTKHIWKGIPWWRQSPKQLPAVLKQYLILEETGVYMSARSTLSMSNLI